MGFGQGLSGLKAASENLDVIGNNISNSKTVGFKAATVAFADVYASSRVGLGVQVAAISQRFTTGNLSTTGNQFDMAIDGDKGFFRLTDSSGQVMYSRNGQFHADKDFNIVNAQGQQLTGYRATADGKITGELMPIKVPVGNVDPKATTEATVRANFDSREDVISTANTVRSPAYGTVALTDDQGDTKTYKYGYNAADPDVLIWVEEPKPEVGKEYTYNGDESITIAEPFPQDGLEEGPDVTPAFPAEDGVLVLSGGPDKTDPLDNVKLKYSVDNNGKITWDTANIPAILPQGTYTSQGRTIVIKDPMEKDAYLSFPSGGENKLAVAENTELVAFDPTRTENHSHSLPMTVYDSLGNPHQLTQYFVKTAASDDSSEWEVYYKTEGDLEVSPGSQKLTFNKAGVLTNPAPGAMVPVTISGIGLGNPDANPATPNTSPANELVVNINYGGSTQFGGEFSPKFTQNGYTTGEYSSMEIAGNGDILAKYTNGETRVMGAIALADFNNLNGLKPIGGNAWIETSESGQALLGRPGTNGLATLKGQSVEESNVDMSEELVNMIIAQRTYQANAQTIKTQDQILQTLITLR